MAGSDARTPRPSSGQRTLTWLRQHSGKVASGLLTLFIAPIIVYLITTRLGAATSPSPSSARIASPPAATATPLTETEVRLFRPFTDEGLPTDYEIKQVEGECFGSSMTSADPAALRCAYNDESGSPIVDPCWANVDHSQVACTIAPWERSATLIDPVTDIYIDPDLEDGLVTPDPESDPFAMEIITADGNVYHCTAISAYAGDVAGYRRNYSCEGAAKADEDGYIFGNTERADKVWRVRFTTGTSTELVFVRVVRVWL